VWLRAGYQKPNPHNIAPASAYRLSDAEILIIEPGQNRNCHTGK
jgi:hypothetical protein